MSLQYAHDEKFYWLVVCMIYEIILYIVIKTPITDC